MRSALRRKRAAVDQSGQTMGRLVSQHDVLGYRQFGRDRPLLVDHGNAAILRRGDRYPG